MFFSFSYGFINQEVFKFTLKVMQSKIIRLFLVDKKKV